MSVIWINLAFVYLFSSLARITSNINSSILNYEFRKPNKLLVLIVIISLALVAGLRNGIGDTTTYMRSYWILGGNDSWSQIFLPHKEKGFLILQLVLLRISNDPQILIFTTAIITNALIVLVLYKYSRIIELSIYIYITSGLYIVSMNGLRQFLAAAILFTATKYLIEGHWLKYSLVVLLASTIHQSAIIFIPLYFFVRRKAWTKNTFFLLAFAIVMMIGYNQLSGAILQYAGDYSQYSGGTQHGANLIRVFVTAAPLMIVFLGREKLREIFPQADYFVNMSLLGLVFMIISTQNWIFARYTIYFGLYNLILISWSTKLFTKKGQNLIYFLIICLYFLYCYYEDVISLNLQYTSDFIKFL